MESKALLLLWVLLSILNVSFATEVSTTPPFVAQLYVPQISRPRQLLLDFAGDILVSSASSRISAIRETNHGNGTSTVETTTIVDGTGLALTHGIAIHDGYLYASSAIRVYRWPYKPGQFSLINPRTIQTVITNITQTSSGHSTRTLTFDEEGRLYISVGSLANIDTDSYRSRIRRFTIANQFLPIPFNNGEIFADGCRNTVGLGWSNSGILYGVDNGADMLNRPDLGGAIWPENPAEEMNKFNLPINTHYGYPFCWSTYNLRDYAPRTQFAWPTFLDDGTHTDEWCQNPSNNAPPILSMPAHSAPLSIEFFKGVNCGVNGAFPCEAINDAFVAFRGSWHQGVSNGYKVSWYPFDDEGELPTGEVVDVIYSPNATNSCNSCLRAAGATFNKDGHLIVSGDTTNEIFRVAYDTELPVINNIYH
ncbi:hypothetical protein Bhyg_01367 [Pseudolycoriella hygida]|uniref:Pyrroloquinoline quinone-dependent pyranose dehydrogenase beta-propeller domain-containing protein n=1 Tax=Pseudolycoriella hygida TaxID=35572 RepID=A0A9Q0NAW7_9DIPT|nr:hypothetical protein Bhyg_01367 [Pseudolycoriella hygida]